MQQRYNPAELSKVIDQALLYQCACPAQVCRAILELRELYDFQLNCANDTANDRLVHESIAAAADAAHVCMEACLTEVLKIEGWDTTTMDMPEALKRKIIKSF